MLTLCFWIVSPKIGRQLGLWLSVSYASNILLKAIFAVPRPFQMDPGLASPAAIATTEGYSFPSAHAQTSATFWMSLAIHDRRRWLWSMGFLWVMLVSASRILLGVHHPVDVLAGLILGSLFAWGCAQVMIKPVQRRKDRLVWIALSLVIVGFFPSLAKPVGVGLGFGLTTRTTLLAHKQSLRGIFSILGLGAVFLLLKGSSWIFQELSHNAFILWLRYAGVVLFATEAWPMCIERITKSPRSHGSK